MKRDQNSANQNGPMRPWDWPKTILSQLDATIFLHFTIYSRKNGAGQKSTIQL